WPRDWSSDVCSSISLRQRNSLLAREPFYCHRFFVAKHCSAGDPAGPPPIANFKLCRQQGNFHFETAPKQFAFKSEFRNFRKRCRSEERRVGQGLGSS